ncbi:MAG: TetR/AcrR family transcriptional regulator [Actinomycetota bacterium]
MRVLLVSLNSSFTTKAEPRKRPRQERSRRLVATVLAEAARLFDERGYTSTTTNHIAEAADISVGSLYQYFPNKDSIVVALAEAHLESASTAVADLALRLRTDPPDLPTLVEAMVDEAIRLNDTDRLHAVLWTAPRTDALVERLEVLNQAMAAEVAWHLIRLGHPEAAATIRARTLVVALEACVHDVVLMGTAQAGRAELVRLCQLVAAPDAPDGPTRAA